MAKSLEAKIAGRRERWREAFALVEAGKASPLTRRCVELVEQGLSMTDIAKRLGKSNSTIGAALRDPTGEAAMIRKHRHCGVCERCGGPTYNGGCTKTPLPRHCNRCAGKAMKAETRQRILEAIEDFQRRYGRSPTAWDWNIAAARQRAHPERLAQIEAQHADRDWPNVSAVQAVFGSWNAALMEAGCDVREPGHRQDVDQWKRHRRGGSRMPTPLQVIEREIEKNESRQKDIEARKAKIAEQAAEIRHEHAQLLQAKQILAQAA